jgi:hypothetical protein
MPDTQYWKEMDNAVHYPPAQKARAEKAALIAWNKRKRTQKTIKPPKTTKKKTMKKKPSKNGAKKIRKARQTTKRVLNIFG